MALTGIMHSCTERSLLVCASIGVVTLGLFLFHRRFRHGTETYSDSDSCPQERDGDRSRRRRRGDIIDDSTQIKGKVITQKLTQHGKSGAKETGTRLANNDLLSGTQRQERIPTHYYGDYQMPSRPGPLGSSRGRRKVRDEMQLSEGNLRSLGAHRTNGNINNTSKNSRGKDQGTPYGNDVGRNNEGSADIIPKASSTASGTSGRLGPSNVQIERAKTVAENNKWVEEIDFQSDDTSSEASFDSSGCTNPVFLATNNFVAEPTQYAHSSQLDMNSSRHGPITGTIRGAGRPI